MADRAENRVGGDGRLEYPPDDRKEATAENKRENSEKMTGTPPTKKRRTVRRWTSEEAEEHLAQLGTYVGDETGATQNKGTEPEKTGEGADANKEDGITRMAKRL